MTESSWSLEKLTHAVAAPARDARRQNRSRILSAIRFGGVRGRAEISAFTGFTEAAVSRITRELIDAGVLREEQPFNAGERSAGRPLVHLSLVGSAAHVLAYEIAANAQSVSLFDMGGAPIARAELELLDGKEPSTALRKCAAAGLRLIADTGVAASSVLGAGVSVAGGVNPDLGVVLDAPNIGWRGVELAAPLAGKLGMPVRVESRASALLLAEHRLGVARHARNILLINLALGIGGAVMLDGRMVRGRHHASGQIAHMPMPGATARCLCGKLGCLDTLASGRAILRELQRLSAHADPSKHGPFDAQALRGVAAEADRGQGEAVAALAAAGRHLGKALSWAAAAVQPELIALAGVPSRCPAYVEGVLATYSAADTAPIVVSQISNESAAGELALDAFVYANGLDLA